MTTTNYGIVLISDIARLGPAKDRAPDRVNFYEVISSPPISVDLVMDIRYCARRFTRVELSGAPVVENSEVIGYPSDRSGHQEYDAATVRTAPWGKAARSIGTPTA